MKSIFFLTTLSVFSFLVFEKSYATPPPDEREGHPASPPVLKKIEGEEEGAAAAGSTTTLNLALKPSEAQIAQAFKSRNLTLEVRYFPLEPLLEVLNSLSPADKENLVTLNIEAASPKNLDSISSLLSQFPNLTNLGLVNCSLSKNNFSDLEEALKSSPRLAALNLSSNEINDECDAQMVQLLNKYPRITSLNLSNNPISGVVASSLIAVENLKKLTLSEDALPDDSREELKKEWAEKGKEEKDLIFQR